MNDRTPTEAKLLPCPFCGGGPRQFNCVEPDGFVSGTFVRCDACGIDINDEYEAEAIAAWNRRASPPAPAAEPVAEVIHAARGHDPSEKEITAYGKPYGAWADTLKIVEAIKPYMAPLDAAAIRAEARREALKEAAKIVRNYDPELNHSTGTFDRLAGEILNLADKGEAE